jgi:hypothetical protein
MPLLRVTAVYCDNHTKHLNTTSGQQVDLPTHLQHIAFIVPAYWTTERSLLFVSVQAVTSLLYASYTGDVWEQYPSGTQGEN